jgi:hypothetical protein
MARLVFHASHEQFPPSELLALVRATEMAGFDCGMSIGPLSPVGICSGPVGVCMVLAGSGPSGNIAALWGNLSSRLPLSSRYHCPRRGSAGGNVSGSVLALDWEAVGG